MKWTPLVFALFFASSATADSLRSSAVEPMSADGKAAIETLRSSLKGVGLESGSLSCERLVVISPEEGQDVSYGGVCTASGQTLMVCDDTMVGKLTVKFSGFALAGSDLAEFTNSNCPPGG